MEFNKLADHAFFPEHLHHSQNQVRGRGALWQRARQLEADHLGDQHGDGLAQHGGFRLDAAHAPAKHAQTVDHGGVGIRAHHRVGKSLHGAVGLFGEDRPRKVFQIDLMHDAGVRRDDLEIGKRLLSPTQKLIPFPVALKLQGRVSLRRVHCAEDINHDGVIDDQLRGGKRVDPVRVAPQGLHGVAHGGQINHRGDAGEVLHQHAGRGERDLLAGFRLGVPVGQSGDVVLSDIDAIFVAQQVLQQDLQAIRQAADFVFAFKSLE